MPSSYHTNTRTCANCTGRGHQRFCVTHDIWINYHGTCNDFSGETATTAASCGEADVGLHANRASPSPESPDSGVGPSRRYIVSLTNQAKGNI